ncbi:MAG: nucleotidyltransferase family protein [Anaerolineales bacterium]|nr:nucleotidyltransferase family protein [Anaerolineales bacterium]
MISAIILAAGESRRMGEQKLLMPWGDNTVIEHIISVFQEACLADIVLVTGSHREEIEKIVSFKSNGESLRCAFNENFSTGEMLASIQCGLRDLVARGSRAALVALGDQPQVRARSVRRVCDAFDETGSPLIVPSFNMRRGHPWLIGRELWDEFLDLTPPQTPRVFLDRHKDLIRYVDAEDDSVLADLDTLEQYRAARPK